MENSSTSFELALEKVSFIRVNIRECSVLKVEYFKFNLELRVALGKRLMKVSPINCCELVS